MSSITAIKALSALTPFGLSSLLRPAEPRPLDTDKQTKAASAATAPTATRCSPDAPAAAAPEPITVINLNSSMGAHMGSGDARGADLNADDITQMAYELLEQDPGVDVITMQEMAQIAAEGELPDELQTFEQLLEAETGDEWTVYFGDSGYGKNGQPGADYHAGKVEGERGYPSRAGNVIFVREGSGIRSSTSITPNDQDPFLQANPEARDLRLPGDDGWRLDSSAAGTSPSKHDAPDGLIPGSIVGVEVTTDSGERIDIYTTHITHLGIDSAKQVQAAQINYLREVVNDRTNPVILTGDFNVDPRPSWAWMLGPILAPRDPAANALNALAAKDGFTHASAGLGNTSGDRQIDHIYTKGIEGEASKFDSMSDDDGLMLTDHDGLMLSTQDVDSPASDASSHWRWGCWPTFYV